MVIASMQEIHLLEGAFNFVLWKLRLQAADSCFLVEKLVVLPTNPKDLV